MAGASRNERRLAHMKVLDFNRFRFPIRRAMRHGLLDDAEDSLSRLGGLVLRVAPPAHGTRGPRCRLRSPRGDARRQTRGGNRTGKLPPASHQMAPRQHEPFSFRARGAGDARSLPPRQSPSRAPRRAGTVRDRLRRRAWHVLAAAQRARRPGLPVHFGHVEGAAWALRISFHGRLQANKCSAMRLKDSTPRTSVS